MDVRNCRKCGQLFNYVYGVPICPACKEALENTFKEVKKYIQEHPGVGIKQVSEECNVEVGQIQQWVREERLEFASDNGMGVNCESCGAPIRSGRYCDKCKTNLANGFRQAIAKPEPKPVIKKDTKDSPKMRFLG